MDKFKWFKEACAVEWDYIVVYEYGVLWDTQTEQDENISYALSKWKKIVVANQNYVIEKYVKDLQNHN